MVEPVNSVPVLEKLLVKTQEGRIAWHPRERGLLVGTPRVFSCGLPDEIEFTVGNDHDTFWVEMKDSAQHEIFTERVEDEIVFGDTDRRHLFELVHDLYELARRSAFQVDKRLGEASAVLDRL